MGIFGEKNVYITIDRSGVRARLENGKTEVFKTGEVNNIRILAEGPTVLVYTTKGFKRYQVKQGYESLNRMLENTTWGPTNPIIEDIATTKEPRQSSETQSKPTNRYYEEPAEIIESKTTSDTTSEENANEEIKNMFNTFQSLDKQIEEDEEEGYTQTMNPQQSKMAILIILVIFFIFFIFPIIFTIFMTIIMIVFSAR